MGDRFKKTQAGQPLEVSAEVWNAYIDAVRAEKGKKHDLRAEELSQVRQGDIIKVRNASGEDRLRFHVLGIKTPIIMPGANLREFKNQVSFDGVRPKHPEHYGRFMILLDPMRIGKIGRAWVSGVCPAYITVEDECHQCCDVKHDDPTKLKSCPKGSARILWREGGTGDQWAVVRLSNVFEEFRRFILLGSLSRCGSAQAQRVIYKNGKWCDSDCPFIVYDSLGVVCPEVCKCGSGGGQDGSGCGCCNAASVPAGTFGWAKWMYDSEKWELVTLGEGCCKSGSGSGSGSGSSGSGTGSGTGTGTGSGSGTGSGTGTGSGSGTVGPGSGSGGLTITRKVLIPCPRREGDYLVFPSETHTYIDGRLTNVEPSGEECRVYICCCSCGSGSGSGTGTGSGTGSGTEGSGTYGTGSGSGTGSGTGSGSDGSGTGSGSDGTGSGSDGSWSGSGSNGSGTNGSGGSDGSGGSGSTTPGSGDNGSGSDGSGSGAYGSGSSGSDGSGSGSGTG